MDINAMISQMTDEQAYRLLEKAMYHAAKLQPPVWASKELTEAIKMGIDDGGNPMALVHRYQAAIMAERAVKKALKMAAEKK